MESAAAEAQDEKHFHTKPRHIQETDRKKAKKLSHNYRPIRMGWGVAVLLTWRNLQCNPSDKQPHLLLDSTSMCHLQHRNHIFHTD